ncbi:MAG: WXG100 family type VII secretion target [bacterium]|nr:WXG100 family type VII secretion target [bacterium]
MADLLQANYEQLEDISTRFSRLCERIQALSTRLRDESNTLCEQGWKGKGSEAFLAEMTGETLRSLNFMSESFCEASTITTEIRTTLEDAENRSAQLFRA